MPIHTVNDNKKPKKHVLQSSMLTCQIGVHSKSLFPEAAWLSNKNNFWHHFFMPVSSCNDCLLLIYQFCCTAQRFTAIFLYWQLLADEVVSRLLPPQTTATSLVELVAIQHGYHITRSSYCKVAGMFYVGGFQGFLGFLDVFKGLFPVNQHQFYNMFTSGTGGDQTWPPRSFMLVPATLRGMFFLFLARPDALHYASNII